MTPEEFLKALGNKGVSVHYRRGKLNVEAPVGVITQSVRSQLEQHRDAIIALLSQQARSDQTAAEVAESQLAAQPQTVQGLEAKVEALFEELGRSPGNGQEWKRPEHPAHETWLEFECGRLELERMHGTSKQSTDKAAAMEPKQRTYPTTQSIL